MLIVRLKGGLGNQMFQYAFARKLSLMKNIPVKFDISFFKNDVVYNHHYELNHFNIIENIASIKEVDQFIYGKFERGLSGLVLKFIDKALPNYKRRVVKQPKKSFDPSVFKVSDNTYFDGYWGNENYFKDIENIIRKEFMFKETMKSGNLNIAKQIKNTNSISIHLRKYDDIPEDYMCMLSMNYYHKAVKHLSEIFHNLHFFIFSDNLEWAKKNLKLSYPTTFVEHNKDNKDYDDLRLMSLCKHNVIANSTFSWWGAWLNNNPNKIIIAPKIWYKNIKAQKEYEKFGLVPKNWVKI